MVYFYDDSLVIKVYTALIVNTTVLLMYGRIDE